MRAVLSRLDDRDLAGLQGAFNIVGGLWPLVSIRSFERIFGPKQERWLEYTVGGLLITNGLSQVDGGLRRQTETARRLGIGTASTLLAIDLLYVLRGKIRVTYLLDAVMEMGWIAAWFNRAAWTSHATDDVAAAGSDSTRRDGPPEAEPKQPPRPFSTSADAPFDREAVEMPPIAEAQSGAELYDEFDAAIEASKAAD